MGATLHFSTEQFFENDLQKAEDYFKKIIKYIDRSNGVGKDAYYNPAIMPLLDCLRIVFGEKIYEIRKSNPSLIELPTEKQAAIFADIYGLGIKYDYQNPKHSFVYSMKEIMLPLEPMRMWNEKELVAEKLPISVGFYDPISNMKLDAMTKKILKKAAWHMLVVTLSV
jgi:hypothetical protein